MTFNVQSGNENAGHSGRPHAVVVGGGFAGASAASSLTEAGISVTLIEERPTLGGRARSLRDGLTRQDVDNGQHLFLKSYTDTIAFLKRIKVVRRLAFNQFGGIRFINEYGKRCVLRPRFTSGNVGFAFGIMGFNELRGWDKISLLWGLIRARLTSPRRLTTLTVSQWLTFLKQTERARRCFWEPLCLATLNERPDKASASALWTVLTQGFLAGGSGRAMGWSTVPLSRLWSMELGPYLERTEGRLSFGRRATGLHTHDDRVVAVTVLNEAPVQADVFVLAVPFDVAMSLAPGAFDFPEGPHSHSPIVSINLWFHVPPFEDAMVGLLGLKVQWLFNRRVLWGSTAQGQISAVISAAKEYERCSSEELVALAMADIRRAFPEFHEEPRHSSVVWERRATPSPTPEFMRSRPVSDTAFKNLFLAGDWVNVGLPPTIESACRSGHQAASGALRYLSSNRQKEAVPC